MKNEHVSAVTTDTLHLLTDSTAPFLLKLKKGESLFESLAKCAEILKLPSAALSGIGALENPVLGNFDFEIQKHKPRPFVGIYELTNLTGNITRDGDRYKVHIHVTLGLISDLNCHAITGHLIEADIGIIAEITVTPFAYPIFA